MLNPRMLERSIERGLLASRWLLVPMYVMLLLTLVIFTIRAGAELAHLFVGVLAMEDSALILATLSLIDLALIGNLVVMVALSGYETFVSRVDVPDDVERPDWLGKYDAGTIKLKVAASIVAISSIHLLRAYLDIGNFERGRMLTLTLVHLAFVVSALILAYVDKLAFAAHREGH